MLHDLIMRMTKWGCAISVLSIRADKWGEFCSDVPCLCLQERGRVLEFAPTGSHQSKAWQSAAKSFLKVGFVLFRMSAIYHPAPGKGVHYVLNRTPRDSLRGAIPDEIFNKKRLLGLSLLSALGAQCSYVIPKPGKKVEPCARTARIMGNKPDAPRDCVLYVVRDKGTQKWRLVAFVLTSPPPAEIWWPQVLCVTLQFCLHH
jgi:hypothetical protein